MSEPALQPCRGCGAPLADDQRYCLQCGGRRGEPRVDFRRHLSVDAESRRPPVPPRQAPPEPGPPRDFTPLAAGAGVAVLGLMLVIGVLIGRGDGGPVASSAPQIVRVEGTAGGGEPGGADGTAALGGAAGSGKGRGKGRKAAASPPPAAITASEAELEALQRQSPQEYSESSAKLPNEIATPGEAPPADRKKPGGGSAGTTIE